MSAPASSPFSQLDEAALRGLVPGGAVRSYPKNVVVVSEGADKADDWIVEHVVAIIVEVDLPLEFLVSLLRFHAPIIASGNGAAISRAARFALLCAIMKGRLKGPHPPANIAGTPI